MMKSLEKCKKCGKERYVLPSRLKMKTYTGLCSVCYKHSIRGKNNPQWQDGKYKTALGYIMIYVSPNDFFYPMVQKGGYALEHRLVMARHLNRCLLPWEVVHHKGTKYPCDSIENRSDNRIENLELVTAKKHMPSVQLNRYIKQRENEAYQRGLADGRREIEL